MICNVPRALSDKASKKKTKIEKEREETDIETELHKTDVSLMDKNVAALRAFVVKLRFRFKILENPKIQHA